MTTAARIATSAGGGALIVLAVVGFAYTGWALMTPMFAIFDPVRTGLASIVALSTGVGLVALRRRLSRVSRPGDIPRH